MVDAVSLSCEICDCKSDSLSPEKLSQGRGLVVAPKDIDLLVKNASYLLALAINCALQPELTPKELYALM